MYKKTVMVGPDYIEIEAVESMTPRMAALGALPLGAQWGRKKQATQWVILYLGRERRIYCDVIGNVWPCYVLVKGEKHFVR